MVRRRRRGYLKTLLLRTRDERASGDAGGMGEGLVDFRRGAARDVDPEVVATDFFAN